jgi:methionine-S-sulfoxide reductase
MKATFGAGCFWGIQHNFSQLKGVKKTSVGFMGGHTKNPKYMQVCYNNTGHTEVVQLEYDEKIISYKDLLNHFFQMHNPERKTKTQYKSVIFYHDEKQKKESQKMLKKQYATELLPATEFWKAGSYHQDYFKKHKILKFLCRV